MGKLFIDFDAIFAIWSQIIETLIIALPILVLLLTAFYIVAKINKKKGG